MSMRVFFLLFLAVVIVGCKNTAPADGAADDTDVIVAEIGEVLPRPVDISEFVDSVEFLKLETGDESLIA